MRQWIYETASFLGSASPTSAYISIMDSDVEEVELTDHIIISDDIAIANDITIEAETPPPEVLPWQQHL